MRRNCLQPALLVIVSIVAGWVAWSGHVLLLPISLVFPVTWSQARTRSVAALVSAGYFLAASRGLPQGAAAFYSTDLWPGLLLWVCASASFVAVHALLWAQRPSARPLRYLSAAVLMAFPPFGIAGWAHPLTAAGVLFPGWTWWGLAAVTAGLMGLVTRLWPAVAVTFSGFWLWSAANWTDPQLPNGWLGVDLQMGASLGRDVSIQHHRDLIATVKGRASRDIETIVLPESALGFWTPTVEQLWLEGLNGSDYSVVAGGALIHSAGYDNVLVTLSGTGGSVLYRERMPVPGSMWQPWRILVGDTGGARAHFFDNPTAWVGEHEVAPLICYEQLLVWPILQSMLYDPDLIVAVGNGWWTMGTSIVAIQGASAVAWARLFAKPIVLSFNT